MSAGGSSGQGDTKFSRSGTVNTSSWRDLTNEQNGLFDNAFGNVTDGGTNSTIGPMLTNRIQRGWGDVPYSGAVCDIVKSNMSGNQIPGQASLEAQSKVNPYSSQYADNSYARYADEVHKVLGQSRSGPAVNRGGTAAQGFMMSDAVNQMALNREDVLTKNRQADASIQQGASNQMGQLRGRMDSTALQGAGTGFGGFFNLLSDQQSAGSLASERAKIYSDLVPTFTSLASRMNGTENNNLSGRGAQTSSSMGAGINLCCFIFLEAYNGKLPESVRRYRDMAAPENSARRKGYISMSKWLVPMMRVSRVSRTLANHLLVKPLTRYGEWFYGKNKTGWVFWPVKQLWFKIWELTGKRQ
jgi:hypothetical protein